MQQHFSFLKMLKKHFWETFKSPHIFQFFSALLNILGISLKSFKNLFLVSPFLFLVTSGHERRRKKFLEGRKFFPFIQLWHVEIFRKSPNLNSRTFCPRKLERGKKCDRFSDNFFSCLLPSFLPSYQTDWWNCFTWAKTVLEQGGQIISTKTTHLILLIVVIFSTSSHQEKLLLSILIWSNTIFFKNILGTEVAFKHYPF